MSSGTRHIRQSGGYSKLRSFQVSTVIYDGTVSFCSRFVDKRSRTHDQKVQAARSGRQNIAEGSRAAATSSQTELRLVNVARARLEELLLDFEDFLRQRDLPQWSKNDPKAQAVREVGRRNSNDYAAWLDNSNAGIAANALICLIHQANYLLDRQIATLERQFINEGGYSERLAAARLEHRRTQPASEAVTCPICGKPMALRTAHKGPRAGSHFWGCSGYPDCAGTRQSD